MLESFRPCPNENLMLISFQNISFFTARNVVTTNGKILAKSVIRGPISVENSPQRFDLTDTTRVDQYPKFSVPDICAHLDNPLFGKNLLTGIVPKLSCPVQAMEYSFTNMTIDMRNIIRMIPFINGRYVTSVKFLASRDGGKRRQIGCFVCSVKLFKTSRGRRN